MSSIRKIACAYLAIWLFIMSFTKAETDPSPTIEGCQYIDAFSIDCWWKKIDENSTQSLRLSYIKNSEHLDKQIVRYCTPTMQSINFKNDVIEHCEIEDGVLPFASFTLFLTMTTCNENSSICHNTTGLTTWFSCDPYNVVLRRGPSNFAFDFPHRQLTWGPPQKDGSSLPFVSNIIQTEYKLLYQVSTDGEFINQTWKEWYSGPRDSYYIRQLIPGAIYKTKILASVQNTPNNEDIVWSPASKVIQFTAPYPIYDTTVNDDTTLNYSTTIETNAANDTYLPSPTLKKVDSIWLICIMVITVAIVLSIVIYLLICQKMCCCCPNNVKIPKPVVMIEMDDLNQWPLYLDANEVPDSRPVTSLLQRSTKRNGVLKQITCTLKDVYPAITASRSNSINEKQNGQFRIRGEHLSLNSDDDLSYSEDSDPMWLNHSRSHGQNFDLINEKRSAYKHDSFVNQAMLTTSHFKPNERSCSMSNGVFHPSERSFLCDGIGNDKELDVLNQKGDDFAIERYDNMDYVGEVCPEVPGLLHEKTEQFKKAFLKDTSDQTPDYIQITSNLRGRQNEHVIVYVASNIDTRAFNKEDVLKSLAKSCECKTKDKLSNNKICSNCELTSLNLQDDLVFLNLCDFQSAQMNSTAVNNSENRGSSNNNSIDSGYSPDSGRQI